MGFFNHRIESIGENRSIGQQLPSIYCDKTKSHRRGEPRETGLGVWANFSSTPADDEARASKTLCPVVLAARWQAIEPGYRGEVWRASTDFVPDLGTDLAGLPCRWTTRGTQRPMTTASDPNRDWSPDLSIKLKCAIGDCISLYSEIELCIVEIIWLRERPDLSWAQKDRKGVGNNKSEKRQTRRGVHSQREVRCNMADAEGASGGATSNRTRRVEGE